MTNPKNADWLDKLKDATKTAIVQDGRRKVHYTFKDGMEMAEEYDMTSFELLKRKLRIKTTLGGFGKWIFEVGEDDGPKDIDQDGMIESTSNPIFTRKDRKKAFIWRIRNLPYPVETYDIQVKTEDNSIVIKTTNKKYYKKYNIPDMDRINLPLNQKALSIAHANNTLIITYDKPAEILQMEENLRREVMKTKASKEGDVECAPS